MTHLIRTMFQPGRNSLLALVAAFGALCLTEGALVQGIQLTQEATAQEGPPGQGRGGEGRGGRGEGRRGEAGRGEGRRGEAGRGEGGRGGRGGRGGGRGGWGGRGGGGSGMQQIREQLEPDFMRRDIPIFVTQLELDDTQEIILETIFEDYEVDYEGRSEEVQDTMRTLAREMFQQMMPQGMQQRMGETWRGIREELDRRAEEKGEELSEDERRDFIRERMTQMQQEILSEREEQGLVQQGNPAISAMFTLFEEWVVEKAEMRERFINNLKAQLSDQQMAMWPAFNRFLVREKSLPRSRLSGENANLFLVIDREGIEGDAFVSIEPMFDDYELSLHEALVSRDAYLENSAPKLYRAFEERDLDKAKQIVERQVSYRKGVRDVNERYIDLFSAEVAKTDPDSAQMLRQAMLAEAYEEIYGPTRTQRAFEAALNMELDQEVRSAMNDLQVAYLGELTSQNQRISTVVRKEEPKQQLAEVERISSFLNGNFMGGMMSRWSNTEDPTRTAFEKRRDLDEVYFERLSAVLTPEQIEELPGGRQRGEGAERRGDGERGGRGGPGQGGRGGRGGGGGPAA